MGSRERIQKMREVAKEYRRLVEEKRKPPSEETLNRLSEKRGAPIKTDKPQRSR